MMNLKTKIKQGFLAIFAFALIAGAAVKAQAIEIGPNDLVLVLYGNNTEYYQLVGRVPDIVSAPGTQTFNISGTALTTAGPAASTQWALVSFNTTTGDFSGELDSVDYSFNATPPSTNSNVPTIMNNLILWSGNVSVGSTDPNTGTFPKTDENSFFSLVDGGNGDGRLGNQLPSGTSAAAQYGQSLLILNGDYNTGVVTDTQHTATLSLVNASDLSAGALLTIVAPVPIPASVVLFASGLVGLIGVARRRLIVA